jgi:hypothetical protein
MNHRIFLLVMAVLFAACAGKMTSAPAESDTVATTDNAFPDEALVAEQDPYSDGHDRIIKTAHFRFQVKSVKETNEVIEEIVRKYPSFIASSKVSLENPILESRIIVRVRTEFFHDMLRDIDKQATFVNFKNISTDDVSKQFVDLESRLRTKREVETRYMEILRKKAGTIKELLEAEQQIGELHEEIEATVSRINHLKDQVKYSTINLEFYQTISEVIASEEPSVGKKFGSALAAGWDGVIRVFIGLAYIWPLIILAGSAFFIHLKKRKQPSL